MDKSFWKFGKSHQTEPDWPLEESGEKVKAVLLKETFDSPAESDMVISMLAVVIVLTLQRAGALTKLQSRLS